MRTYMDARYCNSCGEYYWAYDRHVCKSRVASHALNACEACIQRTYIPYSALREIVQEYRRAREKHPTEMRSAHEGFAILAEEVDGLWNEVKRRDHDPEAMKKEAIQVGAMALSFLVEVCEVKMR